jgi:hypothetical protein
MNHIPLIEKLAEAALAVGVTAASVVVFQLAMLTGYLAQALKAVAAELGGGTAERCVRDRGIRSHRPPRAKQPIKLDVRIFRKGSEIAFPVSRFRPILER